jgi:hypothetical protein
VLAYSIGVLSLAAMRASFALQFIDPVAPDERYPMVLPSRSHHACQSPSDRR